MNNANKKAEESEDYSFWRLVSFLKNKSQNCSTLKRRDARAQQETLGLESLSIHHQKTREIQQIITNLSF